MARKVVSANANAHERAENRLLRKMASLHKEKVVMAERKKHAGRKAHHKGGHGKAEERRAGKMGEKAEPKAAKAKGGRDSHHKEHHGKEHAGGHGAEHKMAEVHVHHHHHHHHGGKK